ncbi:MAG: hypothetical protein JSR77_00765 [Planctomycetes bacterium]|nr:hypothetical protein [Planctomycetota bacterium]
MQIQICYDGGRNDSYTLPFDLATPRAAFSTWLGASKSFDDPAVNSRFAHTFSNLPCGIVSATLEVHMRAECDIPENDSLNLAFNLGPNTFSWGRQIKDLPGAGGTWSCPQDSTITLNLAALPLASGTFNLIPQLNADHRLDMYVQDDTTVEYAKLTIRVCPCVGTYRFYRQGYADNFAPLPLDPPTSRQPALTALRTTPPFLWKDDDDCTNDRGWGQTFTGLPSGIVRAQTAIRMIPCGGGSGNDSMNFELLAPGGPATFYRGFNLAFIASGGSWLPGHPAQTFAFDIGTTLPTAGGSCLNFLGALADRKFDIYVQDDSSVDAAALRVWPCPPLRRIYGLPITANSNTVIDYDPAARRLVASNLGSSGQDGVAVDVGGADGVTFHNDPIEYAALPIGRQFSIVLEADVDGDGEYEPLLTQTNKKHFPDGLWVDMPVAADSTACHRVQLSNSFTGETVETCLPADGSVMVASNLVEYTGFKKYVTPATQTFDIYIKICDIRGMRASDGTMLMGDTLVLSTDVGGGAGPERCSLNWGDETGGLPPATMSFFDIFPELNGIAFHECCAGEGGGGGSGDGSIDTNSGSISLSNIASSGQQGVTLDLSQSDEFATKFELDCVDTSAQCGSSLNLDLSFVGSVGGVPDHPLGNSQLRRNQGFFDIFADFSDLGTTIYRIKIIKSGEDMMMTTIDIPLFPHLRAITDGQPNGCGKQVAYIDGWRTSCLWWDFDRQVQFIVQPGMPPIVGDQVRILAANPTQTFDYVQTAKLVAAGVDELTFTGATRTPHESGPPCPADYNGDGGVDGTDVQAFFADWEAGVPGADVNGDGGVDGTDVEVFFAAWSNGGC